MPGRGKLSARRGGKGRANAKRADNGRSVSDEITVLVNTLRELAAIRSTAEDAAGFTRRADVVDRQYSAYTVLDSLHVNGKLTMSENLADIASGMPGKGRVSSAAWAS